MRAIIQLCAQKGMSLLLCDFDCADDPDFMSAPRMNQLDQIYREGKSIGGLIHRLNNFGSFTIIGRTLGTLAMPAILSTCATDRSTAIWISPDFEGSDLATSIASFKGRSLVLDGVDQNSPDVTKTAHTIQRWLRPTH
jgi:hypothetical protein